MKVTSQKVEYRERFRLCDLQAQDEMIMIKQLTYYHPFSALHGWSVRFTQIENECIFAGVETTQKQDISHPVIRKVLHTVRGGSIDWKSSKDFPTADYDDIERLAICFGYNQPIPFEEETMDLEVGVIFTDVESQLTSVNEYWAAHPDTIGHLTEEDLNELNDLRQTEMYFYSDENGSELIHTAMVDLHAMAQLSKYFHGLFRLKRDDKDFMVEVPLKSEKIMCKHFNEQNVADLIDVLHGRQFKRDYFLEKSLDYLIRMGYICGQLQIEHLQTMIDDCIFCQTKSYQMDWSYDMESLMVSLKYSLETSRTSLFSRLWKTVICMKLNTKKEKYEKVRKMLKKVGGESLTVVADATWELVKEFS